MRLSQKRFQKVNKIKIIGPRLGFGIPYLIGGPMKVALPELLRYSKGEERRK